MKIVLVINLNRNAANTKCHQNIFNIRPVHDLNRGRADSDDLPCKCIQRSCGVRHTNMRYLRHLILIQWF